MSDAKAFHRNALQSWIAMAFSEAPPRERSADGDRRCGHAIILARVANES